MNFLANLIKHTFLIFTKNFMNNVVTVLFHCCCSVAQLCLLFVTLWTAAHWGLLTFTISWNVLKLVSVELVMPSSHLILCCPLLLPSVFPSIRVFSNESAVLIRWPKYWSFSISSSSVYSELISFRIDWFDLAVQWTLKILLQYHSSKTLTFLIVWFSCPYKTIGKTILLTRWTFVGKVISLLLNMLSRFGIAFLSKEQASFNFKAAVTICNDFGAQENQVSHCFHCFPIYLL